MRPLNNCASGRRLGSSRGDAGAVSVTAADRAFFGRDPVVVAPELLGWVIRSGEVAVRLTEVEAYRGEGEDPGSHAHRGPTPRNGTMFGEPARLYVYLSHGIHHCANIVAHEGGTSGAVLLRAGQVIAGAGLARERRERGRRSKPTERDLARGPGRLGQALGLGLAHDGLDLLAEGADLELNPPPRPPSRVRTGPRVGVSGPGGDEASYPWRFWIEADPTVSPYRAASRKARSPRAASG